MLSPIILFVYNRPEHTRETLYALENNELASQSILYIFSDGESENSTNEIKNKIKEVRAIIKERKWCKQVIIKESKINKGLANSIIDGVSEIIKQYGKVIVLEDDLIASRYFLNFMNNALDKYNENQEVYQISGFSFPLNNIEPKNSSFFLPITSTWGWATWERVWSKVDFDCKDYNILKNNKKLSYRFNFQGSYNYKKMFIKQIETHKVSSWGIRFYWNAFKDNALILFPDKSLILNNGWDNSGRHNDNYNIFPVLNWDDKYKILYYPESLIINSHYIKFITSYIKKRTSKFTKIFYKIKFLFVK